MGWIFRIMLAVTVFLAMSIGLACVAIRVASSFQID